MLAGLEADDYPAEALAPLRAEIAEMKAKPSLDAVHHMIEDCLVLPDSPPNNGSVDGGKSSPLLKEIKKK